MRQLVMFHSLVLLFKIRQVKKPVYLFDKIIPDPRRTRSTETTDLRDTRCFRTSTAKKMFVPRTVQQWNDLPPDLHACKTLNSFKIKLKVHIKENMPIK